MPKDLQKEMREEAWRLEREAALASIEELGQERQVDVVRDDCRDILAAWPLDRLFDCVIADPPYVEGPVQWKEFTLQWLSAVGGVLADDFHMFIFCPAGEAADYERLLWEEEWPVKSRIIWHWRNTPPQGETDRFLATYEVIFHVGTHDLNWQIASNEERFDVQTVSRPRPSQNDKGVHPEQKPLELITRLVEAGSKPGQNVLDPFAGSGTTGHACLALGDRRCTLVEIKDAYVEDIRYRLRSFK
jgi:DNA modification methylase